MSTYQDVGINPKNGQREIATWVDDAYGRHLYGVRFADGTMYPAQQITRVSAGELFTALVDVAQSAGDLPDPWPCTCDPNDPDDAAPCPVCRVFAAVSNLNEQMGDAE
mgnify:CR=1 FL=1